MTNKAINPSETTKTNDNELDRLFDKSIHSNEEVTGGQHTCPGSFIHKGKTYRIPELKKTGVCILHNLGLEIDHYPLSIEQRKHLFYAEKDSPCEICLTADSTQWEYASEGSGATLFGALYRTGEATPLSTTEAEVVDGKPVKIRIRPAAPLKRGPYLLYLGNTQAGRNVNQPIQVKNGLCYAIEVLADGKYIQRPKLSRCKAEWKGSTGYGLWERGRLGIDVTLQDFSHNECVIDLLCYNDDLSLIAHETKRHTPTHKHTWKTTFAIRPKRVWLPGSYTVILTANRFPFQKLTVTLYENGRTVCRKAAINEEDYHFRSVREMEFGRFPSWNITRDLTGVRQEKRKLLALYENRKLSARKAEPQPGEILLFTAPSGFWASRTAFSIKDMLRIGKKDVITINCKGGRNNYESRILQLTEEREGYAFILLNADQLCQPENKDMLDVVLEIAGNRENGAVVALCFSDTSYLAFSRLYPKVDEIIKEENRIRIQPQSMAECLWEVKKALDQSHMRFNRSVRKQVTKSVVAGWEKYRLENWIDYKVWLEETVKPALCERMNLHNHADGQSQAVQPEDLQLETYWIAHCLEETQKECIRPETKA